MIIFFFVNTDRWIQVGTNVVQKLKLTILSLILSRVT